MRARIAVSLVLCLAVAFASAPAATGGEPVDPNIGDTVFGKAGGLRYAADPATYDVTSGFASVETGCGAPGWHVLGGGNESGGPVDDSWHDFDRWYDDPDGDSEPDDGWLSGGYGPFDDEMTGYAICVDDLELGYRFRSVADQPTQNRTGEIGCGGAGWHVASGSTAVSPSNSWVNSSFPFDGADADHVPDDGWRGGGYDPVGGVGGFSVYAICVQDDVLRYVTRAPVSVEAEDAVTRRVACANDEHVTGGGARVSGPEDGARLVSTFPYDDADGDDIPDDGWQVTVYNVDGNEKSVTAHAICLG
jgi:hypothetical protein